MNFIENCITFKKTEKYSTKAYNENIFSTSSIFMCEIFEKKLFHLPRYKAFICDNNIQQATHHCYVNFRMCQLFNRRRGQPYQHESLAELKFGRCGNSENVCLHTWKKITLAWKTFLPFFSPANFFVLGNLKISMYSLTPPSILQHVHEWMWNEDDEKSMKIACMR